MPSLNITIENYSPLIIFDSLWKRGTSSDDHLIDRYSDSNYESTNANGSSASLTFNGTGIEIFGAKRGDDGLYIIQVDDTTHPAQNGSANPDEFQQSLFRVNIK
ncbi:hypothetical protein C0995_014893 [Termitomyces sp. Mi166|nr:hypothetical protein C0995_014893 [Termitomyces sp. Mi166\